jgi:hypothetical protein
MRLTLRLSIDVLKCETRQMGAVSVELLYVEDCIGCDELRPRLTELIARSGIDAHVLERCVHTSQQARELRFTGSPTVRVDGRDVEITPRATVTEYALACRLYGTPDGVRRIPPDAWIERALRDAASAA